MWGLFIGLPLGLLQIMGIVKFTAGVTGGKKNKYTVFFILGDIVLLLGVFVGMALISPANLLWTASGMAGFMIVASIIVFVRKMRNGSSHGRV
jgi:hypothetical protein